MNPFFDEVRWAKACERDDWQVRIGSEVQGLLQQADDPAGNASAARKAVYAFFQRALANDTIFLAADGADWDSDRCPIDTIVIHHTSRPGGISHTMLSAMHLARIYLPSYLRPAYRSSAIHSGHFREGRQVFYAYHWLVRPDGSVERLLLDEEVGWHAGNWQVNCQSIAICLDGDFANATPNGAMLTSTAALIRRHYPEIPRDRIVGHREVTPQRTCPGERFLNGWKRNLLHLR